MKKWLLCCCLLLALPLAAQAEDEKIDPANYICAEFVAQGAVSQDPPVFQALQIDGYVSSNIEWEADVTKCRAYNEQPENGSGFVIWLDAYNRQYNVTEKSILAKQETLDKFLAACAKNPDAFMIDVLQETLGNK